MIRDYKLEPLKRGEYMLECDIRELFLEQNLSMDQIGQITGIKRDTLRKSINKYNLVKTPEMVQAMKKRNYLEKYGVDSPNKRKEIKEKKKKAYIEKYGVDNPSKSEEVKQKIKQVFIDKYGVDNPQKSEIIKEKTRRTNLEKYCGNAPACDQDIIDKMKHTRYERYGEPEYKEPKIEGMTPSGLVVTCDVLIDLYIRQNKTSRYIAELFNVDQSTVYNWFKKYNITKDKELRNQNISKSNNSYYSDEQNKLKTVQQRKQTCLERYGVDNPAKSEEIKQKSIQTNLEKYGVDNASKSPEVIEHIRQNNLQKYGVEWVRQIPEVIDKGKKSMIEKYGVDNALKVTEIKEKIKQTCIDKYGVDNPSQNKDIKKKISDICQQKYGVPYNCLLEQTRCKLNTEETRLKIIETKRANGTFNTSKPQQKISELLREKFKNVQMEYRSEKYPFACDFYIPEKDLYIEFQGIWTHGGKPYDENDIEDVKLLEEWKEKAKTSDFYANAIEVWTVMDPFKRQFAKQNNLNFLEFFSFNDFMEWYNDQL